MAVTDTAAIKLMREVSLASVSSGGLVHTATNVSREGFWQKNDHSWLYEIVESNSGTQVIILGCLLGVLVIIIYGFKIYRAIVRRKDRSADAEQKY